MDANYNTNSQHSKINRDHFNLKDTTYNSNVSRNSLNHDKFRKDSYRGSNISASVAYEDKSSHTGNEWSQKESLNLKKLDKNGFYTGLLKV